MSGMQVVRKLGLGAASVLLAPVFAQAVELDGMECETRYLHLYEQVPVTDDQTVARACGRVGRLPAMLERSYELCVSTQLKSDPHPVPLVLGLHGGGGSASSYQDQIKLEERGLTDEFIVAYPNGCRLNGIPFACDGGTWNAGGVYPNSVGVAEFCDLDDDVFIYAVISDIQQAYPLDVDRIFAVGHSQGGMFAYRLACDGACGSDGQNCFHMAAIGTTAGTLTDMSCAPEKKVSIFHVHNLQDGNVPFDGGGIDNDWPPAIAGLEFWARVNGCSLPVDHDYTDDVCVESLCVGEASMELCLIDYGDGDNLAIAHSYTNGYDPGFVASNKPGKNIRDAFVERFLE